ncbi:diacylglycerol O-acyltransferase 2A [Pyrenophora tritici-repentis]|uniref:diacylglycerol O-acyltransferase n=2 Tax=Pyrenophora tritici-repentis TaxID=45151 RepID=A0A2W1F4I6_9PLEO|nr:diacylglycerol O-acyltransferase 2A [Pyrenophora tritici-repentis Pt-1C-BFP]KAF7442644.1 Diacylglycerol O-acyltransferase 2A [Pyrenophora tritici-repentis]EDU41812.1 diacylglycerol O-acyltransferase 2A [Pyrenophora tritici-repentis Pt-1C-BFP]KAF7578980.1 diacylglycerol O-acyltransferase 2A [Pyrenophora tritici-repentis]KAI0587257.1 Diacylglycerol O-acyltransferase 2A [Pyrenophora tritici-repentis]KAI0591138.1 Diacylglycerol O-acyltransferase 2A [Pyrenophora tritici-repentis]
MSLNPEPSMPEERAQQDLPPKSYADAAEKGLQPDPDPLSHVNDSDDTMEHSARKVKGQIGEVKINGLELGSNEDDISHEGIGQDGSPKSPTAKGHRRVSSRSSRASSSHKHGEKMENGVYEKHPTEKGSGHALTSVKPQQEQEMAEADRRTDLKRRNSELTTGRQAGAGWAQSKIRFAPMNVPLQRRLQTLAVLMHTLSIVGSLAIFFFLCSIPLLWPILLPYTIYVLFSNAGTSGELSFRSDRMRRLPVWSLFASYFPARLHRSQELEPTRKYIFGYHPHGIISHGAFAAFATEALGFAQLFPGITNALLTLDSNFRYPIYREYALRLGMASVSRESCENILSKGGPNNEGMGRAITIVVGGAAESLDARPGSIKLVLRRRKGFVKMAIRTGADLVPVLSFGENDIYDQLDTESHPYIHKFQMLVKKFMGFTIPIFHARGIFNYDVGMMPYRRPINIVVGRPIRIVQDKHPDNEYINEVHQQYVDELMRIWNEHKDRFAKHRTGELEIVE